MTMRQKYLTGSLNQWPKTTNGYNVFKDKLEDIMQETDTTGATNQTIHVSINYGVQNFNGPFTTIYRDGSRTTREEQEGAVKSGQD